MLPPLPQVRQKRRQPLLQAPAQQQVQEPQRLMQA